MPALWANDHTVLIAALASVALPHLARAEERWGPFPAHSGARQLCWEVVLGTDGSEIKWESYALEATPDAVVAFYRERLGQEPRQATKGGRGFRQGRDDLDVYPAERNGDIPNCEKRPRPGERTVVLVSRLIERPR